MDRTGVLAATTGLILVCGVTDLAAQAAEPVSDRVVLDSLWVVTAAALVFFMQAGFALLEGGLHSARNVVNILMKNVSDFAIATVAFWVVGFGLMFGAGNGYAGTTGFLLIGGDAAFPSLAWAAVPLELKFFFHLVFAGTAATIVSGAIGGRVKFSTYLVFSLVVTALVYPVIGHWVWGGGWLAEMGFHDFAGSTVVHAVGGFAALAGAVVVGPRIGKYDFRGTPRAMPGHSMTFAALGVFILWLGWFGFNAGSTMAADPHAIAHILMTTNLAAAGGALGALAVSWRLFGKPDISVTLNGVLAGLVSITAGCAFVGPGSALLIGLVGGVIVVGAVLWLERRGIDDPVGAIGVHGVCGVWGTVAVGLFAATPYSGGPGQPGLGLLFGGGMDQLTIQLIGAVAGASAAFGLAFVLFLALERLMGLRVTPEEELAGLDAAEHGNEAYPTTHHPIHSPAVLGVGGGD